MSVEKVIQATDAPRTVDSLTADLRSLGLQEGMVVMVHASLAALGWVVGGPQAVVQALLRAVGETGTLVMPAFTSDNSDPRDWRAPAVPEKWWPVVREQTPAFDPRQTPATRVGCIPETFRAWNGVHRSSHPAVSFCAHGRRAEAIVLDHCLDHSLGEHSPLARLYEVGAQVLLLGVGHDCNTSLHLAEYRAAWPRKRSFEQGAAILVQGKRTWVRYEDVLLDSSDFERIGSAFEKTGATKTGRVGSAPARLMSQIELVDFAAQWISVNRR